MEKTERDKIEEKNKGTDRRMKVPNGMAANPSKDYDGIIASTGTSRELRESLEYAVSSANQIKSADRKSRAFSFEDDSILKQEEIKSSIGDYCVGETSRSDALMILSDIEQNQTETIKRELIPEESWRREFIGYIANSFIGDVKLGEHQYQKLLAKGREDTWNYIKPTLERPSLVISEVNEAGEETGRYNFIKVFNEEGNTRWYYSVGVTKDYDGLFSISNRRIHRKQIAN